MERTRAATARLPLKNCSKWLSSGHQLPVFQRQSADPACTISASGKWQPMTTQIRNCRSTKFALDLNTGSRNLTGVNKIAALIGHCAVAAWKNSACNVGTQRHCAAGLAEVNAHLRDTDSSAVRVNTPRAPLSVPLDAHRCRPRVNPLLLNQSVSYSVRRP